MTIKVPKGIMEFLKDMESRLNGTVQDYLEYQIVDSVRADIDGDLFRPDLKEVSEKYGMDFDC